MAQNNVRTGQPEDFMRIQDLFYLCLSKWYWFVISLGITLSVAILYVLVTPPVYMRSQLHPSERGQLRLQQQ